jgi:hypothetical protein
VSDRRARGSKVWSYCPEDKLDYALFRLDKPASADQIDGAERGILMPTSSDGIAALTAAIAVRFWGSMNPVDNSQRHIALRYVDRSRSYLQAIEFMSEAARSVDWRGVQNGFLNSDVR